MRLRIWWLLAVGVSVAALRANAASPAGRLCLPPLFDGGQRLHELGAPRVYWLELLLRQHEVCWRAPSSPHEVRIFLVGNSVVFGHPLPVAETFGARLNDHFRTEHVGAHLFNLGFVTTYQLKDALIIHEALAYRPQLVVYALSLGDFAHFAPMPFPIDQAFFDNNSWALARFAESRPSGLIEPLERYRRFASDPLAERLHGLRLDAVGALTRAAIRQAARNLRARLLREPVDQALATGARRTAYDCQQTQQEAAAEFREWQTWNILAYLQQLRAATGIQVLIVNLPLAHEPIDGCYNVRYPDAVLEQYVDWMRSQTQVRDLPYIDLHALLPAEDFLDSMHVSPRGHQLIAAQLAPVVDALVARVAQP